MFREHGVEGRSFESKLLDECGVSTGSDQGMLELFMWISANKLLGALITIASLCLTGQLLAYPCVVLFLSDLTLRKLSLLPSLLTLSSLPAFAICPKSHLLTSLLVSPASLIL